jgi:hypothetical protein
MDSVPDGSSVDHVLPPLVVTSMIPWSVPFEVSIHP